MYAFKSVAKSAVESVEKQYRNYAENKFEGFAVSGLSELGVDGKTINIEVGCDYYVNTDDFKDFCLSNSSDMNDIEVAYLTSEDDAIELANEIYSESWDEYMNDIVKENIHRIKSDAVNYINSAIGDTVVYFSSYGSNRKVELNFSDLYEYDISLTFDMDVEPDENINDNGVWLLDAVKSNSRYFEE